MVSGVTYGGYVRSTAKVGPLAGRLLLLDAEEHLWQVQRAAPSLFSSWKTTDLSPALRWAMLDHTVREQTILDVPTSPLTSAYETHFSAICVNAHLLDFWCDAQGVWQKEDLSEVLSQPICQQLGWFLTTSRGTGGSTNDLLVGMGASTGGRVLFTWCDPVLRNWEVFDLSAGVGREVLTGWHTASWADETLPNTHLVAVEED
jgi:hypothetical protein